MFAGFVRFIVCAAVAVTATVASAAQPSSVTITARGTSKYEVSVKGGAKHQVYQTNGPSVITLGSSRNATRVVVGTPSQFVQSSAFVKTSYCNNARGYAKPQRFAVARYQEQTRHYNRMTHIYNNEARYYNRQAWKWHQRSHGRSYGY